MDFTIVGKIVEQYRVLAQEPQLRVFEIAQTLARFGLQTASTYTLFQLGIILPPDEPPPIIWEYHQPSEKKPSAQIPRPVAAQDIMSEKRIIYWNKKDQKFSGSTGDDDIFEYRITDPAELQKAIRVLRNTYKKPVGFWGRTDRWDEFETSIQKILNEIAAIISDREKLTAIIKEAIIITPTLTYGEVIGQLYLDRLKKAFRANGNQYGIRFTSNLENVQNYLQRVSKAQLTDIALNTNLPKEEVQTILIIGGAFTHHQTCYWRFADQIKLKKTEENVVIKKGDDSIGFIYVRSKNSQERYYDLKNKYGSYPLIEASSVTEEVWREWEPKVLELIKPDLKLGWEIDRKRWGASCLVYEQKRINSLSVSGKAWAIYLFLALMTSGLGLLTFPFFKANYIELKGVRARLVMKREAKPQKVKKGLLSRLFKSKR